MSAITAQQVFALGGSSPCLALLGEEYVRQMFIGNNWTRLHIGLLFNIEYSSGFPGFDLRIGTCTFGNPTQGVFAWNTRNWIGAVHGTATTGNCNATYTANAGAPYFTVAAAGGVNFCYGTKVGQTFTAITQTAPSLNFAANTNGVSFPHRSIIVVQITKGSPNYTVYSASTGTAALNSTDYNFGNLLDATQQMSSIPPGLNNVQIQTSASANTGACSEALGVFDAVSIAWKSRIAPLQIYGIAVYRVT